MTKFTLFRVKNAMLFSNFISNLIGVSLVLYLTHGSGVEGLEGISRLGNQINWIFLPCTFVAVMVLTLAYERPIRQYLWHVYLRKPPSEALTASARRRLLNEPFYLIGVDFGVWLVSAVLYPSFFWAFGADKDVVLNALSMSLIIGLITSTVAFFVFEFVLQRRVVPFFFPDGGLYMTARTIRIRIRTRLIALLFACNLIPFVAIINDIWQKTHTNYDPDTLLKDILSRTLIFMAVGIWLTFLVSSNLTKPLENIIRVLRGVRNGEFENKVRVASNDEIGYTGDVINEMTVGLKERDFVKETFGKYVTKEIRDEILSGGIPLDGELKEVTVLFADLRDFTPMVEALPPKEVVSIINGYFKEMDEAIKRHQGLVLQYIGDEIEAVFGAPIHRNDHPLMAVKAALEMRHRLHAVNMNLKERGHPPLAHGIGIHTGEVVAANIGSPDRLSYALVGDTVNLASRLQGLNKEFGTEIIISAATRAKINGDFPLKAMGPAKVKGKAQEVQIFSLV